MEKNLWQIKPINDQVQKVADLLYLMGKQMHFNNHITSSFVFTPKDEYIFISPTGVEHSIRSFFSIIGASRNYQFNNEFNDKWNRYADIDTPIMFLMFEDFRVNFWMCNCRTTNEIPFEKHEYELKIHMSSIKNIAQAFSKYYNKELTQYHEIPLNKSLFSIDYLSESDKLLNYNRMWKLGTDLYIIEYLGTNESNYLFKGTLYATLFKDGYTGSKISSSLNNQLRIAVLERDYDYRKQMEIYDKQVALDSELSIINNQIAELNSKYGLSYKELNM